ncbi:MULTISPECIES: ATP-binding protein [unclassified Ruegeria]|uniref:sensor histidine kinase n=1 Tax=unclassified Ruegeria TaxID=2625375 RepID=UPI001489ACA8|nr:MULTISPECIES: ATP-binding protein [unclassified Ruegeria]NOD65827.1 GHKL domain-containing protein [Ruegeria sp. HKCCD6109]
MRSTSYIVGILVAIAASIGLYLVSYQYFVSEELSKAQGRLSLYQSSVNSELERFSHLTYVLSQDSFVIGTAEGDGTGTLNRRLEDFAAQAGLDAIYLMNEDGITIAASNFRDVGSFVGQNYAFRPYFQTAISGEQGRFYAIGATTGLPGYFIANAVRNDRGVSTGVIAIKIDFSDLQDSWKNSGEQVLLANEDGVVLLSSNSDWQYRVLTPLSDQQKDRIRNARQFPGQDLDPMDWAELPGYQARIAGAKRLHLAATDLPHGWSLHYFASDDQAVARSWLVTAVFVLLAGLAFFFIQIQRARRVSAALVRSEEEEVKLREANERLAVEIDDRKTAERSLKRTQSELERASRLAALGQLSASVTHELGQPIAAMRNHLVAEEISSSGESKLPQKIGSLVDRMEAITRQLRFFARSESEAFDDVDLRTSVNAALALVAPNIEQGKVKISIDAPTDPVFIRGSALRIEQVITNLLRNAIDAMDDADAPEIHIAVKALDDEVVLEIQDNGHGLGEATLAELQEPFVTTRESGRGMGLGLAISTSIVKDHDGTMTARNRDGGGTIFRVSFPIASINEETDA